MKTPQPLSHLVPGKLYIGTKTIPVFDPETQTWPKDFDAYTYKDIEDSIPFIFIKKYDTRTSSYIKHCKILVRDTVYTVTINEDLEQFYDCLS